MLWPLLPRVAWQHHDDRRRGSERVHEPAWGADRVARQPALSGEPGVEDWAQECIHVCSRSALPVLHALGRTGAAPRSDQGRAHQRSRLQGVPRPAHGRWRAGHDDGLRRGSGRHAESSRRAAVECRATWPGLSLAPPRSRRVRHFSAFDVPHQAVVRWTAAALVAVVVLMMPIRPAAAALAVASAPTTVYAQSLSAHGRGLGRAVGWCSATTCRTSDLVGLAPGPGPLDRRRRGPSGRHRRLRPTDHRATTRRSSSSPGPGGSGSSRRCSPSPAG